MKKLIYSFTFVLVLSGCGEPQEYRGGDFYSLEHCMLTISNEGNNGNKLRVNIDEPDRVIGSLDDGETWGCNLQQSGTRGYYWTGGYFVKEMDNE